MGRLRPATIVLVVVAGGSACIENPFRDAPRATIEELLERADQGDSDALFELGNRYADGDGVSRDNVLAYMWFELAAERLTTEEGYEARRMQLRLDPEMFRHQIAEAERLARLWKAGLWPPERRAEVP